MHRLRIKEIAEAKGFTIARLEREAGIDIKTARMVWHHPEHNASLKTLGKIAKALGVSIKDLLEDDEHV
jgi:transcriptional regulator with XRE-family HTH domain